MTQSDADAAFYLPQYRFWEIALGALAALVSTEVIGRLVAPRCDKYDQPEPWWSRRNVASFGVAAALAAIVGFAFVAQLTVVARAWSVIPVVATAYLLLVLSEAEQRGSNTSIAVRILTLRPIAFVGAISYSLYLWHWPIIAFLHTWDHPVVSLKTPLAGAVLAATFAAAYASYRLIEQPYRTLRPTRTLVIAGVAAMAVTVLAASSLQVDDTLDIPYAPSTVAYQAEVARADAYFTSRYETETQRMLDEGNFGSFPVLNTPYDMLVVGNSHMQQFHGVAADLAKRHRLRTLFVGVSGPRRIDDIRIQNLVDHVLAQSELKFLVMMDYDVVMAPSPQSGIETILEQHPDLHVVMIKDNPPSTVDLSFCKAFTRLDAMLVRLGKSKGCATPQWKRDAMESQRRFEAASAQLRAHPRILYVDDYYERMTQLDSPEIPGRNGNARYLYSDDDHLSASGYEWVAPMLVEEIERFPAFTRLD